MNLTNFLLGALRHSLFTFCQLLGDDVQNFSALVETAELANLVRPYHFTAVAALGQRVGLQSQMTATSQLFAFGHMVSRYCQFCSRMITIDHKIEHPASILPAQSL